LVLLGDLIKCAVTCGFFDFLDEPTEFDLVSWPCLQGQLLGKTEKCLRVILREKPCQSLGGPWGRTVRGRREFLGKDLQLLVLNLEAQTRLAEHRQSLASDEKRPRGNARLFVTIKGKK